MELIRDSRESPKTRVAVVYPYIPHYRQPVFSALYRSKGKHAYAFFAGQNFIDGSIKSIINGCDFEIRPAPIRHRFGLTFQSGLAGAVLGSEFKVFVFLGNPYFLSTWVYAVAARLRGKKVYFWTHGWLTRERGVKGLIRKTFYRLAHGLLLYGSRAKNIGIEAGFSDRKLHVVYNSLDYQSQARVRERCETSEAHKLGVLPPILSGKSPYVACIARLTAKCRFDLAIDAIALLNALRGTSITLALIGDGPERRPLEVRATSKNVDVVFLGEIYDEDVIGAVLFNAQMVVSPGKVGLTAMHSLAYGTPVITHGQFDDQMPEFEAVVPGVTGDFFQKGDAADLAAAMSRWLDRPRTPEMRRQCVEMIEKRYTPERQVELIEAALDGVDCE